MALLTAEDVLNKAFSKTKYREGFDQDEVDDFLDEVANAISALTAERDELQSRLAQYQSGSIPVTVAAAVAPAPYAPVGTSSASADLLAAATDPNPPSASTMLSMAQKLHDDYLQAGEAERDRIINEGKAKAESIVEQAETDARVRMQSLDSERADLERRIDDLRRFERDYRGHLRNYLENLLGDLEHNSARGEVIAPGVEAPSVTTPPLFGSAPVVDQARARQEEVGGLAGDHEVDDRSNEPQFAFVPSAQPEPFAPAVQPEPFAPAVQPEPFAPAVQPEPFAPAVQPETPFQSVRVSEDTPVLNDPETLPPFPGSSQLASPFGSPFDDANPFAPVEQPASTQSPVGQSPASALNVEKAPEEETPRWNF